MLELDATACYRAIQTRDKRFDGRLFTAVLTTGIYCRPMCPARTPKLENCRFFSSAAAAQHAGFRPCLRCRPEISPHAGLWNGTSNTVTRALDLIAEGMLDGEHGTVEALAERLGVGERHLRRLFSEHLGVAPVTVAQTRRVLFAKQLIHETSLPLTQVAMASGFGSLRRFNAIFRKLYGRPPRELRRDLLNRTASTEVIRLNVPYQPPYDWDSVLRFLRARSIAGVERVETNSYWRTFEFAGDCGVIAVCNRAQRNRLEVAIETLNVRALPSLVRRVGRVFDTRADIQTVTEHLAQDPGIADMVAKRPGLRTPGGWDGFELAIRAILGQQITVEGARGLAAKLTNCYGKPVDEAVRKRTGLTHLFPTPAALAVADLTNAGMPKARAAAICAVAAAAAEDPNLFDRAHSLEAAVEKLRALPGIGEWTAQYIALRALRETDAFPASDLGLLRGLWGNGKRATPGELLARAEQWRPWRAYAAQHLWANDEQNRSLTKHGG